MPIAASPTIPEPAAAAPEQKQRSMSKFAPNLNQIKKIDFDSSEHIDIHPSILELVICLQDNTL